MLREVMEEEFRRSVKEGLVLADFYSATCGPCKMLSFVLADVEKACGDKVNIMKVDFDKNKVLVEEYGVSGYPTLIFMKDGEELKRLTGLQQKPAIIKMIEEAL
ncbi:MAG: thioredoxin fold domain-containing protein [Lachnospiraceae bacterium]|uniref:thioredoxin family protein n=1 Tax=Candidatus Merdisoma sp. JLR.KK006 TaxID=3112626 RepID=UPI002FF3F1C3|nr:thioredoxin fold domain-containing protein [Lachnospiraceae bacterium]